MEFLDFEFAFSRAIRFALCRKKIAFVFPFLFLCSLLFTFCRAISLQTGMWVSLSMIFTPLLLSSGILLSLGIILIRMYFHEVKNTSYDLKKLLGASLELVLASAYLSIPLLLAYLVLWITLGVFMAFREIPGLGEYVGALVSFAPFLLILLSVVLFLGSLAVLFFWTPAVALHKHIQKEKMLFLLRSFSERSFRMLCFFFLALLPIGFVFGLLAISAYLTSITYLGNMEGMQFMISWFLITVPASFLLSPPLIFFFNFAAESYQMMGKKRLL